MIIIEEHSVSNPPPKNLTRKSEYIFNRNINFKYPKVKVDIFSNVNLNSDGFFWKRFKFLNQSFFNRNRSFISWHLQIKFFLKSIIKKKIVVENGVWLIDSWSNNFHHWFGDVLYKKEIFNDYNRDITLLVPKFFQKNEYVRESLKLLNINFLYIPNNEIVKCKTLHFLSFFLNNEHRSQFSGHHLLNYYSNLRLKIRKNLRYEEEKNKSKIYLTRENARYRKVTNEANVRKLLSSYGFKIIDCDVLSWLEQTRIFYNSDTLVTINGSGLTNMLYMSDNSKILEFRHPSGTEQNHNYSQSCSLGNDYYFLVGEPENFNFHFSNLKIDLNKLESIIKNF